MKKNLLFLLLMVSVLGFSQAKEEEKKKDDEDLILDALFDEDADKDVEDLLAELFKEQKDLEDLRSSFSDFKFLYFSTNYNSNTYFAGRDLGSDEFNIIPQISYIDSRGFFASISQAYISGLEAPWNFTGVTLGYGKAFGKKKIFRYTFGYSRFIYNKNEPNPFTNSVSGDISFRNKKRTLGTRLSVNYSFGDGNDDVDETIFQTSLSVFGVIDILDKDKFRLQIRPNVNVLFGEQVAEYDVGNTVTLTDENGEEAEYVDPEYRNVFDLMNIQLSIPLLLSTEKWDFELGYNHNFPNTLGDVPKFKNTNFINVSIGYLLEL